MKTYSEYLQEKIVRKKVVRNNKVQIIKKSDKKGYKVQDGKEVRQSSKERIARRKAAKIRGRRMKTDRTAIRKRLRSAKKARNIGGNK